MKDTRPIRVQVAELTEEQKQNIPTIYKYHLIFSLTIIGLFLLALLISHICVVSAQTKLNQLENELDTISVSERYALYEDWTSAIDQYDSTIHLRTMISIIGGSILIVLALAAQFYINKKYPYYNEKKYFYLKKSARQG